MMMRQWIVTSVLGFGLGAGSASMAMAQSSPSDVVSPSSPAVPATPAPEGTTSAPTETLQEYTLPQNFSFQIPQDWNAEGTETDRFAVITNYNSDRPEGDTPQPADIRTEVMLVDEHPSTFVDREVTAIIDQAYRVHRYTTVEVDELTALRLWISDLPLEYSYQIITFVGYASYGTARIVTYYNTQSEETDRLIEQIHDSFELVF
ncbi:MAG: PsbP-related protein [Cyanobacteria bacterium J06639_14]